MRRTPECRHSLAEDRVCHVGVRRGISHSLLEEIAKRARDDVGLRLLRRGDDHDSCCAPLGDQATDANLADVFRGLLLLRRADRDEVSKLVDHEHDERSFGGELCRRDLLQSSLRLDPEVATIHLVHECIEHRSRVIVILRDH